MVGRTSLRLGALLSSEAASGAVAGHVDFAYDDDLRVTSETVGAGGTMSAVNFAYDDKDGLLSCAGDLMLTLETLNGELAGRGADTFAWDALGQLRKVDYSKNGGPVVEYLYDGLGRRVAKKLNGTMVAQWLYGAALGPMAQLDDAGNLQMRFVYGTKRHVPDYVVSYPSKTIYRLITDQLGSVRLVVNTADGTIAQQLDYDPWGHVLKDTSPGFQPFGFAGGVVDQDTGFVHFGAREYDPGTGRWMRKDPLLFGGGSTNLYAYVLSDPINNIDPEGTIAPVLVIGAFALAGGVGSTIGYLFGPVFGQPVTFGGAAKAFLGGAVGAGIGALIPAAAGAATIVSALSASVLTAIGGNISAIVDIFGTSSCPNPGTNGGSGTGGQGGAGATG